MSNVAACSRVFEIGAEDVAVSFLPLAQIFQRTVDYLCFLRGASICYLPDVLPDVERLGSSLRTVRPTLMAAAPVVYQRAHDRMQADIEKLPAWRRQLFRWALGVGGRYADAGREGFIGPLLALQNVLARRLVHRRIQDRFGGRLRLAISGGAPLPEPVAAFFDAVGMPLYQGYGLTETSPVLATNTPDEHRLGSVGKPLSDVELRIAEDGEILVRGPGVMKGYWQNPGATASTVSESGWLRTGDVGRMDKSGYVFITDRKQDLIVLSSGENIAPRPLEVQLVQGGLLEQAVVIGDGRPHLVALLVAGERLRAEGGAGEEAADAGLSGAGPPGAGLSDAGPSGAGPSGAGPSGAGSSNAGPSHAESGGRDAAGAVSAGAALMDPAAREKLEKLVASVNERTPRASHIRAWLLLPRPLSVEQGELTPTLKVRRRRVAQRYAREVARLYAES